MVSLEGGAAAAAIYSLVFSSPPVAAGYFITSVALCAVHGCWRRDAVIADFTEAADDVEATGIQLGETAKKTEIVVDKMRTAATSISKEIDSLRLVDLRLDKSQHETAEEIEQLKDANRLLEEANAKIMEENQVLKAVVEQLKDLIRKLNEDVLGFNHQNSLFKHNLEKLGKGTKQLETHGQTLAGSIVKFDEGLDREMRDLAAQITKAKASSDEIFTLLAQQNQSLTQEVSKLKEAVALLDQSDGEFGRKAQQLYALEERITATRLKLEVLQKEYQQVQMELDKARKDFSAEREKLESVHRALDKNQSSLHQVQLNMSRTGEQLEQLGGRLAKTIGSLDDSERTLDLEILELPK